MKGERNRRRQSSGKEEPEAEGHDGSGGMRWLLTYADMITLLLAFFIVMYAISVTSTKKFNEFASAVKMGFSVFPVDYYTGWDGKPKPVARAKSPMDKAEKSLTAALSKEMAGGKVKVVKGPEGITLLIEDSVLFETGSADIGEEAKRILTEIATPLVDLPGEVVVEGHTDNIPISTDRFPSNWDLSAARAVTVVRHMGGVGIRPERMAAVGYGEFKPVVPHNPEGGAPENRRIEIKVKEVTAQPVLVDGDAPTMPGTSFRPFVDPGR